MSTRQIIFNRVATHLMAQGAQSTDGEARCAYRGEHGRSCAVGCLIDDEHYTSDLEGKSVNYFRMEGLKAVRPIVKVLQASLGLTIGPYERRLLIDLQLLHDTRLPSEWREALAHLAEDHHLTIPEVVKSTNY